MAADRAVIIFLPDDQLDIVIPREKVASQLRVAYSNKCVSYGGRMHFHYMGYDTRCVLREKKGASGLEIRNANRLWFIGEGGFIGVV